MHIRCMKATFGKLQGQELSLGRGLNILQAPNESGKSTWCAFLLAMFYGINSKERDRAGYIAEKNRYAPWQGSAMSGRLEGVFGGQEITLTRDTRRRSSPLGGFRAVYTGTENDAAFLTGASCGEALLGVTREVYERSAFIRQNGLSITQDAELERRIAALITTGEEGLSFSEAAGVLKKQLNRRRANRSTGLLPELEAKMDQLRRQVEASQELERQLYQARQDVERLSAQQVQLQQEASLHRRQALQQQRQSLQEAQKEAQSAQQALQQLRQRVESDGTPESETIARLRAAIVNLEIVGKSAQQARQERDEAMKALLRAQAAVAESPFAGQTAEQVRREMQSDPAGKIPGRVAAGELGFFFLFLAVAGGAFALLYSRMSVLELPLLRTVPWLLPGGVAAGIAAMGGYLSRLYRRRALEKLRRSSLQRRFGTADESAIARLADTYYKLLEDQSAAQADVSAKSATADALSASLTTNQQAILLEVRRFAPAAFTLEAADAALRAAGQARKALAQREAEARTAQVRLEALEQSLPRGEAEDAVPEQDLPTPAHSPQQTQQLLEEVSRQLAARQSALDQLSGQLQAGGESALLRSSLQALEAQSARLQGEYDAISLAMEALQSANTRLQNRFSPELGRRTAEIFGRLTQGRYDAVTLDRTFHLFAQPKGDALSRDGALLSAGTLDQLYLAARLAICDLVLPTQDAPPIVLDDALASFDDTRCGAALSYLKELSRDRQILLFTCHSREADFFAQDPEVLIQQLTNEGCRV